MKTIVKICYIIFTILFLVYLAFPTSSFPNPPNGVYQSGEPADIESFYRRGYYTDLTRAQVMDYYINEYGVKIFGIKLPTYSLNYPPEESQIIIRDQTRSTFLEEIVQPFRESIFVNGYEPKLDKDVIIINGYNWRQKIIIKQFVNSVYIRVLVGLLSLVFLYIVLIFLGNSATKDIRLAINKFKK